MKTCALVIGHKNSSQGAVNKSSGTTEFTFNESLSKKIEDAVTGVTVQRIFRRTYQTLPGDINDFNPDFIISLHCNAFNESVSGTEVLYYHRSTKGEQFAAVLQKKLLKALKLNDRGIKPKTAEDRGGFLLRYTQAPCILAEHFFIDNDSDLKIAKKNQKQLVQAYADAISAIAAIM